MALRTARRVRGARSPARLRRRQNRRNKSPRCVGQVGVVESNAHRTVPLARICVLSTQTSTFQTLSKQLADAARRSIGLLSIHVGMVFYC
jgi:hypothetical protein